MKLSIFKYSNISNHNFSQVFALISWDKTVQICISGSPSLRLPQPSASASAVSLELGPDAG
jgi:hypothetical protein